MTTRHRIDVAYPVRLLGMLEGDAKELISREAAKKEVILTPQQTAQLIKFTGGVPLAMVWSIGQMGYGDDITAVLRRFGNSNNDIIRFCFEGSISQVKDQAAYQLLKALSLFMPDGSRVALGQVAALPELERDDGFVTLHPIMY